MDVDCSFDETYVKFAAGQIKSIPNSLRVRMSVKEASDSVENYTFENIFYQKIKNHCKLFSSFVFVKTFIFVSHDKYLSIYDVLKTKWEDHISFESEIVEVFRSENGNNGFDICVLLKNGRIIVLNQKADKEKVLGKYKIDDSLKGITVEGEFMQHDQDKDDNRFTFIFSKMDTGEFIFSCFYHRRLFRMPINIQGLNEKTNFVFLFAQADNTRVAIQEANSITVYEITMPIESYQEQDPNVDDEEIKEQKEAVVPEIRAIWKISDLMEYPSIKNAPIEKQFFKKDFHSALSILDRNDAIKFKGCNKQDEFNLINEHFFFIDETHIYKIDKRQKKLQVYEYQCIAGMCISDDNYMYALCHKSIERSVGSGFRLYDMWNCVTTEQGLSYHLTDVQVGCQSMIDLSAKNQRFVFQQSYDSIDVLPVLHRNTNSFMGMGERDEYLATRIIDNKFIALNRNNQLISWDIQNGKMLSDNRFNQDEQKNEVQICKIQDYSNFKIFQSAPKHQVYEREWYSKILLVEEPPKVEEKIKEQQVDDRSNVIQSPTHISDDTVKITVENWRPFSDIAKKNYHKFKLIEIQSEKEVKEILSFIQTQQSKKNIIFNENVSSVVQITWVDQKNIKKPEMNCCKPFQYNQCCIYN